MVNYIHLYFSIKVGITVQVFWIYNDTVSNDTVSNDTAKQTWFRDLAVVLYNRYMINS